MACSILIFMRLVVYCIYLAKESSHNFSGHYGARVSRGHNVHGNREFPPSRAFKLISFLMFLAPMSIRSQINKTMEGESINASRWPELCEKMIDGWSLQVINVSDCQNDYIHIA